MDLKTIRPKLASFWKLSTQEKNAYLGRIVMDGLTYWVIVCFWILFFLFIFAGISRYFPRFSIFLEQFFSQWFINLLGVAAIAIGGLLLYIIRENFRMFYAAVEIGFSLSYGWLAISKARDKAAGFFDSIAVVAVIYLIVRGLDNLAIGWEERKTLLKQEAEAKAVKSDG